MTMEIAPPLRVEEERSHLPASRISIEELPAYTFLSSHDKILSDMGIKI
jgi:hypothetical protein